MVDHPRQTTPRTAPRQAAPSTDAPPAEAGDRIAKVLARAGVASRRDIERLIEEGRVAVNGAVLTTPGVKLADGDIVTVDGVVVDAADQTRLWRYHKPVGLITAHKDPGGRPTVFDNLPGELPRVISVGRLDLNSEGLLLLTNDGELARALEIPSSGWVRTYRARAYGSTTQAKLDRLKDGVVIDDVSYGPIDAKLDKAKPKPGDNDKDAANLWVTVSLTEGKNREVRKVLESIGLTVNRLIRLAYGPFALATLPVGAVEEVGPRVIREQLADLIPLEKLPKGDRRPGPAIVPEAPLRPQRRPERREDGEPRAAKPKPAIPRRREAPPVVVEKKEHKPGWAKPKRKPNPHAAARKGAPIHAKLGGSGPQKPARTAAKPRGTEIEAYPKSHRENRPSRPPSDRAREFSRGPRKEDETVQTFAQKRMSPELAAMTPYERAKLEFAKAKAGPKTDSRDAGRPPRKGGDRDGARDRDSARPARSFEGRDPSRPARKGPAWARPVDHAPETNIRPWAERGSERTEDKPAKPKRDFGGAGGGGKPAGGRSFGDKPSGGKSFGGKPDGGRPGGRSFAGKPAERSAGPRAEGGKSFGDKPRGPRPPPRGGPKGGR